MNLQRRQQTLIGCVFTFVLALFVAGCGGGGDSTSGGSAPAGTILVQADAGDIVAVRVNQTAILDGSASSTTLSGSLTFEWSFISKPDTSNAVLQNATSVNPDFIPDVEGTYRVQLVVSAGGISSERAIALVEASISGNFTGLRVHTSFPSQCADCHDGRFAQGDGPIDPVPPKSGSHTATTNMCEACHTTFGFNIIRFVDHAEVFGDCSNCHNGVDAVGKSEFHVKTSGECNDCHKTTSFLQLDANGNYDHTGISSGCVRCHNGTAAIGLNHNPDTFTKSNNDCSYCHTTTTFKGAYPDHNNITARCDSCHNGTDAKGIKTGHPVMSVDCGTCHSVKKFSMGGVFNHRIDAAVQSCASCHNDNNSINARGKLAIANHVSTTADCGVCHGVGGGNFALGILDHSDPTVLAQTCDSCHGVTAKGKSVNHMPTILDCASCHTTGNFATGVFDHDPAVVDPVTCSSCHDGVITASKGSNHIPTTADCRDCHSTNTFTGVIFDHGTITTGCATCHDGKISTGKTLNHMPTVQDCSDCHGASIATFTDFKGGVFDHLAGVSNNCATCHDGVIALDKKVNHIPSQKECSQCHADTTVPGGFAISTFITDVHPSLSNGCEGCHTSKFFPVPKTPVVIKQTGHLPTNQDCHFCHTNVKFTPQIFTHKNISGNCASCHDGNYVTPAGALGKASDPTPPHPDTTADCGVCHGIGANFTDGIFDHTGTVDNCSSCHGDGQAGATTKKHLTHVSTVQDCSVCHVPGTFTTAVFNHIGIVNNCASCHDGSVATATVKSTNHLATADDCSVCHNTTAFAGAKYDHTAIVNNCASCHDGNIALGKDGNHVPTSEDCSVCHKTTGFIPGTFDHTGIVDNCQSCHDGFLAKGKPTTGHVVTSQDCGACHTTRGFIPATFDHSTVSVNTRCDSCHGVTSTGKDAKTNPAHIATSLDCRSCHTTATFVGGTWTHDASSAGTCDSCHNDVGGGATPKPTTGHISTNLQCDACHTTTAWALTNFVHDPNGNYPGDHRRNLVCSSCHGNIVTTPFVYPSSQYQPFCAACHEGDFKRKGDHVGGENGTLEQNKDCSGGGRGCHKVSDNGF